jgi:hypothetical protein
MWHYCTLRPAPRLASPRLAPPRLAPVLGLERYWASNSESVQVPREPGWILAGVTVGGGLSA